MRGTRPSSRPAWESGRAVRKTPRKPPRTACGVGSGAPFAHVIQLQKTPFKKVKSPTNLVADGLVRVGTGRRKGAGRHLARRERSRAGFEMGDHAPAGRDRVAGWATARVAPTNLVADGLVRVGTGRRKDVGRHLARRERSRAGFEMGDRAPAGRDGVAGWASARVAPTNLVGLRRPRWTESSVPVAIAPRPPCGSGL